MRVVLTEPGLLLRPASTDLSDLTASERDGLPWWEPDGMALNIPFDPEPSPAEQDLIRRRLMTRDTAHETRVAGYVSALAALDSTGMNGPLVDLVRLVVGEQLDGITPPATPPEAL